MAKVKSKGTAKKTASAKKQAATRKPIVKALRQVVADSYTLLGETHLCHWNVRGHEFFALHQAFQEQYTELFQAIDEIAERIRALGAFAPGGIGNLSAMSGAVEIAEDADADAMVEHLASLNRNLLKSLRRARDTARQEGDAETEDLMVARIQVHEKTVWMLESFLA